YTAAVDSAWEHEQLAQAAAVAQWYDTTTSADTVALTALAGDAEAWNTTYVNAWQSEVNAILGAFGTAVDTWAASSGTNYAQLVDTEVEAWISGTQVNAVALVTNASTDFDAEVAKDVLEDE